MPRPDFRALTEWLFLIVFGLGLGYVVFVNVSPAAGIWFALLPLSLFVNERLVGRLPLAICRPLQAGISLGYLAVLSLLLWASR